NSKEDWARDPMQSEICRLPVGGGQAVALTDRDGPDTDPAVSPDGRLIAYVGFDDQHMNSQDNRLYVMNADGSAKRVLTASLDRPVSSPQWSDDGRSIYVQYADRGEGKVGRVMLDGRLTEVAGQMAASSLDRPYSGGEFDQASGVIAYTVGDAQRPSDLAVIRGGKARRLTDLNAGLIASKQ